MAKAVASLGVSLTARTKKFTKSMRRARKTIRTFGRSVTNVGSRLAKWGTISVGAAVGGLTLLERSAFKTIDAIGKTSDKLGIATENLIGLHHAAKLSGVATNTFDMALQRMTRRLAEASQDTGEAKLALRELGLNAQELGKLPLAQQFSRIADAMEGVEGQGNRVRLAFKLFDSEGVALVNTLRGGSKALKLVQADANKLGLTFNRIDAAKVEAANDAMTRLRGAVEGAARTLAVELAPFVGALSTRLTDLATEGGGLKDKMINAFEGITNSIAWVADALQTLKIAFMDMRIEAARMALGLKIAWVAANWDKDLGDATNDLMGMQDEIKRLEDEYEKYASSADSWGGRVKDAFRAIRKASQDATEAVARDGKRAGQGLMPMLTALDKLAAESRRVWEQTRTPMERYETQIEKLNKLLEYGALKGGWDTYKRAVRRAREELEATVNVQERMAVQAAPKALMGTAEAFEARYQHRMGGGPGNVQNRQLKVEEDIRKILQTQQTKLDDIRRGLREPTPLETATFTGNG